MVRGHAAVTALAGLRGDAAQAGWRVHVLDSQGAVQVVCGKVFVTAYGQTVDEAAERAHALLRPVLDAAA